MSQRDWDSLSEARLTRRGVPSLSAFTQRTRLPAWGMSLLLHGALFALLATLWTSKPHGTGGQPGGPVGIAVVSQHAGEENYFLMGDSEGADSSSTESDNRQAGSEIQSMLAGLPSAGDASGAQASLLSGLLPELSAGSGENASGSLGLGTGGSGLPTGGRGGSVQAKLFGVEGEGNRFVYVIDRSDSMNGYEGKPMRRAKEELLESLNSLGATHQFQIIFYNDSPTPYGGFSERGPQLLHGDDRTKELASRFVQQMSAIGGTNHVDALRQALAMSPDVLFFLTDGDMPRPKREALDNIVTRAARAGTTIHCIQFGEGNRTVSSGWISDLAEATGGKFKYIDVSKF